MENKTPDILSLGSYQGLNDFVTLLRGFQVKDDLDALIGVSGFKGFGKSTFSKQVIIRYVEKYMNIKKFTPTMLEKYTAYTKEDLFKMLDELPEYSPIDADEAVNFAMGEDWMKSGNKKMKKVMAKIRNKHHLFFFNIPDLWWLDKKYRENMMTIWAHIIKKGNVIISVPNTAPGVEDRWDRPWLQKAFTKDPINYFTPLENIMKRIRKYSCYYDEFPFPKLDEEIYKKHLELRNAKTLETPEDDDSNLGFIDMKWRDMCRNIGYNLSNNGSKMSVKDIWEYGKYPGTDKFPMTYDAFRRMVTEMKHKELMNENGKGNKYNIEL